MALSLREQLQQSARDAVEHRSLQARIEKATRKPPVAPPLGQLSQREALVLEAKKAQEIMKGNVPLEATTPEVPSDPSVDGKNKKKQKRKLAKEKIK